MTLSPGSKGWISKYFELVASQKIRIGKKRPRGISENRFLHVIHGKSGILFGYPSRLIFAEHLDDSKWTVEEKLKLLLFESHLLVYQQHHGSTNIKQGEFIDSLLTFYAKYGSKSILNTLAFFVKESPNEKLEGIFAKRIDIQLNLLENKWWVNSLSNVFVYLDVILYHDYLKTSNDDTLEGYSEYAYNALTGITLAAYSDGIIEEHEKAMFDMYLASANLKDNFRKKAIDNFKKGASFSDFTPLSKKNWLLRMFIIDLCFLTIFSTHEALDNEVRFVKLIADYFAIPSEEVEESIGMVESFVVRNNNKVVFLKNNSAYEKVYKSLSSRWTKLILRNKEKLGKELKESKDLITLIKKSTTQELSDEEKGKVKTQFMDIARSVPALAVFMLPGGAVLLPLLLKLLPDLVPTAFRDNELGEDRQSE